MVRLERRDFLRAIAVVAGPPILTACGDGESTTSPAPDVARYFPQSVASGDPRPTSVVLWTRAVDPSRAGEDVVVTLVVATDPALEHVVSIAGAASLEILAAAEHDGCIKIRVEGLAPATSYYYRFTLDANGERVSSHTGRTRTAPDEDAGTPVSFAVVSCQDYGGKYFHAYRHLLEQNPELDFVLHLGDYVYETTADPGFQSTTAQRQVTFGAPDEAISLGDGSYLAARSLGNYRDLYRTYRSDPDIQRVHERFPFVVIPDDHEFSNDYHGATATYTQGREDELDPERRKAADRAWFEFMPVDYATEPYRNPAYSLTDDAPFPDDFRIYRSFVFGKLLELVLTDLRRYRPDHLVAEDAFPGAVFMDEASAKKTLGSVPDDAVAYVSIDAAEFADLKDTLAGAAEAQGFERSGITGNLSVPWINETLAAAGEDSPLDPNDTELPRGYTVHQLLKTAEFSSQGSRYLVAEAPFRALAAEAFARTEGASERIMGEEQRAWFLDAMLASTRTWKVWGNEYGLMQKAIDLSPVTIAPEGLRQRIVINTDDWDGVPNERNALLEALAPVENLVVVTGDLHSFFAGTPYPEARPELAVVELIAGSVTSTTLQDGVQAALASDPTLPPEAALIAGFLPTLLTDDDTRPNPHLGWLELQKNGYATVRVEPAVLSLTAHTIDSKHVATPPNQLARPLAELFGSIELRVPKGSRALERKLGDTWKRWDPESMTWA
jgi:alkaline phosphatase D